MLGRYAFILPDTMAHGELRPLRDPAPQASTTPGRPCVGSLFRCYSSSIYEFFCAARETGTHFLVRTCIDRLAGDGRRTVARVMARVPAAGQHRIAVTAEDGSVAEAVLKLRYERVRVLPPVGKQKRYPALNLGSRHRTGAGFTLSETKLEQW